MKNILKSLIVTLFMANVLYATSPLILDTLIKITPESSIIYVDGMEAAPRLETSSRRITVTPILTNNSDREITVVTCGLAVLYVAQNLGYSITPLYYRGKIVKQSAARLGIVVLKTGESAALPDYQFANADEVEGREIVITYYVDNDLAKDVACWEGALRKSVIIGRKGKP